MDMAVAMVVVTATATLIQRWSGGAQEVAGGQKAVGLREAGVHGTAGCGSRIRSNSMGRPHLVHGERAGEFSGLAIERPRVDALAVLALRDVLRVGAGRRERRGGSGADDRWLGEKGTRVGMHMHS